MLKRSASRVYSVLNRDKYGEVKVRNFVKSAEGKVFSKSGSLLSNQTTKSTKECCFKCVQKKECLSVNTIALDQSRFQCELLNWTGTGFEEHLVPKPNSKFMQVKTACSANPCQNGGQCTIKDGGTNYTCTCTLDNSHGRNCEHKKCALFDFETGRLDGWTLTGTAFNNQPTYGDNTQARGYPSSNLKGNWSIGTYEDRPSPSHPPNAQGILPQGTATSPPFLIQGAKLTFLIGGGSDINVVRLELLIGGVVVAKAVSSQNVETMEQQEIDTSSLRGQVAQVRIVDKSSWLWGVIYVDHIQDSCT
ncbi:hypothetical protein AC249_AIPGENE29039 [Exaiptasia diaphana]|nr:hypothetical protein AC249_AIPGENE29039 [Exaiptasia diaphana]